MHWTSNIFGHSVTTIGVYWASLNYPILNFKKMVSPKNVWIRHWEKPYWKKTLLEKGFKLYTYQCSSIIVSCKKIKLSVKSCWDKEILVLFVWQTFFPSDSIHLIRKNVKILEINLKVDVFLESIEVYCSTF